MLKVVCDYCHGPNNVLLEASSVGDEALFNKAWISAAAKISSIGCTNCGAQYKLVPGENGTAVVKQNISRPMITAVHPVGGAPGGGYDVIVYGKALDVDGLEVTFGAKSGTVKSTTATTAIVTVPNGTY
ncbi:MAG: hypothetical protein D6706_21185, partial [Chloroflexi bacterium]